MSEICDLLPDCQESQFDQLALCMVNFLQNEVKSLLRNRSADNPAPNTNQNLLSESVLNELDLTLQPTVNATDSDADDNGEHDESLQSNTSVLDTSITKLKQAANFDSNPIKTAKYNKRESTKLTKNKQCFDECKVKKTSKKKYAEIQCIFCTKWYHEVCVGIKESESRKENPQKLTQLSTTSHPRHLVGKRTAQKDTIIYIISDSQVNSNFPYRWSPASLTFNKYFYLFLYLYIT